ncbi:prepilin peptidase [Candidatus Parcubacteria bacterium]|nr:MAG: prepilin peptidase [Candidatus Parcubacteria bacterium]
MPLLYSTVIFLIGLCIGSFLNVVIDRLPKKESIAIGRSYCDSCKKKLTWYELIPVISYFLLIRRCKSCKAPLSLQYPLIETVTGIFALLSYMFLIQNKSLNIASFISFLYYISIISSFIAIFVIDIKYGIIPDKIIIFMLFIVLSYSFIFESNLIIESLISAASAFLFFLMLVLITKGKGMGSGDAKLAFAMGLILSFPKIVVSLYLAFLTGAFVSIILVIWGKKHFKKSTIPFAPFLSFGTILSLFLGNQIWQIARLILQF